MDNFLDFSDLNLDENDQFVFSNQNHDEPANEPDKDIIIDPSTEPAADDKTKQTNT